MNSQGLKSDSNWYFITVYLTSQSYYHGTALSWVAEINWTATCDGLRALPGDQYENCGWPEWCVHPIAARGQSSVRSSRLRGRAIIEAYGRLGGRQSPDVTPRDVHWGIANTSSVCLHPGLTNPTPLAAPVTPPSPPHTPGLVMSNLCGVQSDSLYKRSLECTAQETICAVRR